MGAQPAQQVWEYLLVLSGPASMGGIYGIFLESLTPDRHLKLQTRTPDKTVQQSDTNAEYAAFHRAQLHTHASEAPKNMGWLHRANEKEH